MADNPHAVCPVHDTALLATLYDNNSSPRNQADLKALRAASSAAYAQRTAETHRYGQLGWQTFDAFLPANRPVGAMIFVHGGRWQLNTSRETAFWAEAACDAGLLFIGLNFPALSEAGLLAQVDAVAEATGAALEFTDRFDIDPATVCLAGHSSGAHLALTSLLPREGREAPAFASRLGALLLLGGIYDLAPLRRLTDQATLAFSDQEVLQGSPLHLLTTMTDQGQRATLPPTLVAVGADETSEFLRQGQALHWILQKHEPIAWHAIPGAAHFDAALEFNAQHSVLRRFAFLSVDHETDEL